MNRTTKLVLSGVTGAFGAYLIIADISSNSLLNTFNRKACDDQAPFKVLEAKLPTNGNSFFNARRKLCVYSYTDKDGNPAQLTWKP